MLTERERAAVQRIQHDQKVDPVPARFTRRRAAPSRGRPYRTIQVGVITCAMLLAVLTTLAGSFGAAALFVAAAGAFGLANYLENRCHRQERDR